MTTATVSGPSFLSLQVRDLAVSADFYKSRLGLVRAPQAPPGAVVFTTSPIPFAVRNPTPGTDLDSGQAGLGVALWLSCDDAEALHESLVAAGVPILTAPFDGPFGKTLVLSDPDGYAVTVHSS
ncbi:VOC family protein [Rhodococcus sp. IEGM 1401]|uniref:VOC family protein n=1 Tax=unclassified Rhodococcus (in: high G+C Gram-positive bacteria) TaxID=192944 RepID=UPI0022B34A6A|nr:MULTISPECIES: VOC family protein [unclassified Rhodococcus (in: high G+C Gram-positive bacteria)]MCZ4562957.1 VOC family protein [Rhodococcus sp. IEGM 1401]MDI9923135.1 VOC family protein [Rhodococcus sp. IEGM 1372]MDV8035682.1 VOC family protein [Rhodococcus sp. IEGM 1414]